MLPWTGCSFDSCL